MASGSRVRGFVRGVEPGQSAVDRPGGDSQERLSYAIQVADHQPVSVSSDELLDRDTQTRWPEMQSSRSRPDGRGIHRPKAEPLCGSASPKRRQGRLAPRQHSLGDARREYPRHPSAWNASQCQQDALQAGSRVHSREHLCQPRQRGAAVSGMHATTRTKT